ncbi:MAG: hypothetical protein QM755_00295 [Luteolibacter sp.]
MEDGHPALPAAATPEPTTRAWEIDKGSLVVRDGAVLPEIDFAGGEGVLLQPLVIRIPLHSVWLTPLVLGIVTFVMALAARRDGDRVAGWFLGVVLGWIAFCVVLHLKFGRRARITVFVTEKLRQRYPQSIWINRAFSLLVISSYLWSLSLYHRDAWWISYLLFLFIGARFFASPCQPICIRQHNEWFHLIAVPRKVLLQLATMTPPREWREQSPR